MIVTHASFRLLLAIACAVTAGCSLIYAQTRERMIDKESWRDEPIRIIKLKVGGKDAEIRKKFQADDDWLKAFSVKVQNISGRPIARIVLRLDFPRPDRRSDEPMYNTNLVFGREPTESNRDELKLTQPSEFAELKIPEANLPFIRTGLRDLGYPEVVDRVRLILDSVIFADGSVWAAGDMLYPDPSNPTKKINPKIPRPEPLVRSLEYKATSTPFLPVSYVESYRRHVFGPLLQTPASVVCTTVYNLMEHPACESGSGCTFQRSNWSDGIEFLGIRNAIRGFGTTHCEHEDGTLCSATNISLFVPLPCGYIITEEQECYDNGFFWNVNNSTCQADSVNSGCSSDQWGFWNNRFDCQWVYSNCECYDSNNTPIIIDTQGNGYDLTNAPSGVNFDLDNHARADRFSWTSAGSDDAFLVLDRNGNGVIDDGSELFGSATHQTAVAGVERNGFLALAEFDKSANGGNGDGSIDSHDSVFSRLRLWQDVNHNGVTEPSELYPLSQFGVESIALDYRESRRNDQNGNVFRYRAKIYGANHKDLGRWAYDVILQKGS